MDGGMFASALELSPHLMHLLYQSRSQVRLLHRLQVQLHVGSWCQAPAPNLMQGALVLVQGGVHHPLLRSVDECFSKGQVGLKNKPSFKTV